MNDYSSSRPVFDPEVMQPAEHETLVRWGLAQPSAPVDVRRPASLEEVQQLSQVPKLAIGDRVRWRKGMRNAAWPPDDAVCIVSQIIEPPVYNTTMSTSSEGAARNDIALAVVHVTEDEDLYIEEYLYDSRRFERVLGSD